MLMAFIIALLSSADWEKHNFFILIGKQTISNYVLVCQMFS